jgi:hypothetical protein
MTTAQRKASFTDSEWADIITRAALPGSASDSNIIRAALGLPPLVRGGSVKGREIKVSRKGLRAMRANAAKAREARKQKGGKE